MSVPAIIRNKKLWQTLPFINGKFQNLNSAINTFQVHNPANGEIIASLPSLTAADVDQAASIASSTFNSSWRLTSSVERSRVLKKMADLMEQNRDDLAAIVTLESGKPLAEAKGEMIYAQSFYEFYSDEIRRQCPSEGQSITSSQKTKKFLTIQQPIGMRVTSSSCAVGNP